MNWTCKTLRNAAVLTLAMLIFAGCSFSSGNADEEALKLAVPFTAQAPTDQWESLPYSEACEEAVLVMLDHFSSGEELTAEQADAEILKLVAWEEEHGYGIDLGAEDIAKVADEFYDLDAKVYYDDDVTTEQIKAELDAGNPVVIPTAGTILANPDYTAGGPPYHVIVLIGYNKTAFIAHDPGVTAGDSYKYSFATIEKAIHDWNGSKDTIMAGRKAMVVVEE